MARSSRARAAAAPAGDARNNHPSGPQPEVSVRMYRQGLGDCFLLTFPREGRPLYMLIDCGVLLGTEDQDEQMRKVAESIVETTGGRIDVLVATHEHWDHLSGFVQAGGVFDQIEVGEVWFAWTEDPHDELANKLRGGRDAALKALTSAHLRLQAAAGQAAGARAGAAQQAASALGGVLEFSGPLAAARGKTIKDALDYVRGKVSQPRYCRPGSEPITLPGVAGVSIYVLGPPENEKLIKKSDPTKKGREVYELATAADDDRSFLVAIAHQHDAFENLDGDERRDYELNLPFDLSHRIPIDEAQADPFFQEVYYGRAAASPADDRSWRQIETDWLGVASDLALRLDNDTNNTSLALAIELSPSGNVLLFPGDAQVGNWLSWAELAWPKEAKPEDANAVTAERLLARTVLYKVGHHASHNATLRDKGLELMTSPHLAAMIPVDERVAREKKKWDMPFGPLLRRLEEKTRGRVIRADRSASALAAGPKPERLTEDEWRTFRDQLAPDPENQLFVEYRVPLVARAAAA